MKHPIPFLSWTGRAALEIEIPDNTKEPWRLKVAVEVAVKSRANLSGAYLRGADLSGANLSGAYLGGAKVKRILASVQRVSDGYTFNLFDMEVGPPKIAAGCRFLTVAGYAAHVANEYPDTAKARETLRILDYFDEVIAAEVKQLEIVT